MKRPLTLDGYRAVQSPFREFYDYGDGRGPRELAYIVSPSKHTVTIHRDVPERWHPAFLRIGVELAKQSAPAPAPPPGYRYNRYCCPRCSKPYKFRVGLLKHLQKHGVDLQEALTLVPVQEVDRG